MSRYFSRPSTVRQNRTVQPRPRAALYCEDEWNTDPLIPNIEAPDHQESFTGLLDARGDEIWRGPNPMGFHW